MPHRQNLPWMLHQGWASEHRNMTATDTQMQSRNESFVSDVQDQQDRQGAIPISLQDELHRYEHSDVESGTTVFGLPVDDWMAARRELAMHPLLGHALLISKSIDPSGLLASEHKALSEAHVYDEAGNLTRKGVAFLQVQQRLLDLELQQLPERYREPYSGEYVGLHPGQKEVHQQELEREQEAKSLRTRNVGEEREKEGRPHAGKGVAGHLLEDAVQISELASLAPALDEPSLPEFG
jgi:hypothetical protein